MHRPRRVERAEHFTELARGQGLLHFLVGVPVGGDDLSHPPQAQLVVATLGLLDHQVHCPPEVAVRELRGGIQATKPSNLSGASLQTSAQ